MDIGMGIKNDGIKNDGIKNDGIKNINVYSSFIFIVNVFVAFYKCYYLYAFLFLCLTVSSIVHHTYQNIYTNIIDKIVIFAIVIYGGNLFFQNKSNNKNIQKIMIVSTFLLCIFLYIYGYIVKDFCFHHDLCIGNSWHSLLHGIGSVGHILIMLL